MPEYCHLYILRGKYSPMYKVGLRKPAQFHITKEECGEQSRNGANPMGEVIIIIMGSLGLKNQIFLIELLLVRERQKL